MRIADLVAVLAALGASAALTSCVVREVRHCPGPYPECGETQMAGTEPADIAPQHRSPGLPIGEPGETFASTYPPEPLVESVPELDDSQVWVDGYWHWNGTEWVWISGQALEAPGDDYVYVEPSYDVVGNYCAYTPGYWQTYGALPSAVVVVRDRYRPPRVRHPRRTLRDRRPSQADSSVVVSGTRRHRRPHVRDRRDEVTNNSPRPHLRDRRSESAEPRRPRRDRFGRTGFDRRGDRAAPAPGRRPDVDARTPTRPRPGASRPGVGVTSRAPAATRPGRSRPDRAAPRRPRIPPRPAAPPRAAPPARSPWVAPAPPARTQPAQPGPRVHRAPGVRPAPRTRPAPPRVHRAPGARPAPRTRPATPAPRGRPARPAAPAPRARPARSARPAPSAARARPARRANAAKPAPRARPARRARSRR